MRLVDLAFRHAAVRHIHGRDAAGEQRRFHAEPCQQASHARQVVRDRMRAVTDDRRRVDVLAAEESRFVVVYGVEGRPSVRQCVGGAVQPNQRLAERRGRVVVPAVPLSRREMGRVGRLRPFEPGDTPFDDRRRVGQQVERRRLARFGAKVQHRLVNRMEPVAPQLRRVGDGRKRVAVGVGVGVEPAGRAGVQIGAVGKHQPRRDRRCRAPSWGLRCDTGPFSHPEMGSSALIISSHFVDRLLTGNPDHRGCRNESLHGGN